MFVNQVLFRHENVASDFFLLFGMLEYCSLHFNQKIAKSLTKQSEFLAAKATKIIKISDLFESADVIKFFC